MQIVAISFLYLSSSKFIFITAVCLLFLLKLKWPKNSSHGRLENLTESSNLYVCVPHCPTCYLTTGIKDAMKHRQVLS